MTISEQDHSLSKERRQTFGLGLLKGMGVTLKHLFKHNTVIEYPDEKQDLSPRTRGVIALKEENCTVCMLCARECPDWCIYIDSHKETLPPKRAGGRPRKRNVLDRFAIDYALCMYCGICVEVCPYDALFWSREFEYAEFDIRELTHEKERLSDWMATVLPPPALEEGALLAGEPATAAGAAGPGSAQRPSPPSQATAAEERPEQADRPPEAATASAPPAARATAGQQQAGETLPSDAAARPDATEQRTEATAGRQSAAESARPKGTEGAQPEALAGEAERVPVEGEPPPSREGAPERPTQAAQPEAPGASAVEAPSPAATEPLSPVEPVDAEAVYNQVLEEQRARGSSEEVAVARAQVARTRAARGLRPSVTAPAGRSEPAATPVPAEAASSATAAEETPSSEPEARSTAPSPPAAPAGATEPGSPPAPSPAAPEREDPDAAYERVLAEERAKGSSDAVALARAKAARVRAMKGTRGPS